jgi:hypothetical protein
MAVVDQKVGIIGLDGERPPVRIVRVRKLASLLQHVAELHQDGKVLRVQDEVAAVALRGGAPLVAIT